VASSRATRYLVTTLADDAQPQQQQHHLGTRYSTFFGRVLFWGSLAGLLGAACAFGLGLCSLAWAGGALLWLLGVLHLGSFYPRLGVYGRLLLAGPSDRAQVALTFDDGPDPLTTPQVLQVLARFEVRATFFVIGARAAQHPQLLAQLVQAGHQVENHSYQHAWLTAFVPRWRLAAQLQQTSQLIVKATGRAPRFFRAPIGILSPEVVAAAKRASLQLCGWSVKARDGWSGTTPAQAVQRLLAGARPGAILLLHDAAESQATDRSESAPSVSRIAPAVLEQLLPELKRRGLQAVTLDTLLAK